MVAALGESTGTIHLRKMRDRMLSDHVGRRILRERPLISTKTIDLALLRNSGPGTFGFEYVSYLDKHNLCPDSRAPVFNTNNTLTFFNLR
jgi:ubiquinone biosynthesis protein COQ4